MKRMILCIVMMASLVSQSVLADCNLKGINEIEHDLFIYSTECHIDYGRLRQAEPLYKEQTRQLKKSIEMKDLALKYSDERTENWKKTTYKLEDKLLKVERNNDRMKWVYFGLGIITTSAAVYAAGQLR